MKRYIYTFFVLMMAFVAVTSCSPALPDSPLSAKEQPKIYPDYKSVTIPCNIAPLTFKIIEPEATDFITRFISSNGKELLLSGSEVVPPLDEWRSLLASFNKAGKLTVETYFEREGKWYKNNPFNINVSSDSIDRYLSYRLIPPSYVAYEKLNIMQRDLTSFDETVIYCNMQLSTEQDAQCINCHSYKNYKTDNMQFHARQHLGGTLFVHNGELSKLNLKTDSTLSAGVYPSFNPMYDVVAYSVNKTGQVFHTLDRNKVEVQDEMSDLILYNPVKNTVSHIFNSPTDLEVFPCWSADGRTLYFCSAHFEVKDTANTLTKEEIMRYKEIKYNLLSSRWNPDTYEFSEPDTLIDAAAMGKSITLPRVSPDGRYLAFAMGDYGCFHVWHRDADIYILDLKSGEWHKPEYMNSDQAESYPSWSSNGRWIMFSSRRDDTNYTRVYIAHVGFDGRISKAFLLPQATPDFYPLFDKSFNRPEFTIEPVRFKSYEAADVLKGEAINAVFTENCK